MDYLDDFIIGPQSDEYAHDYDDEEIVYNPKFRKRHHEYISGEEDWEPADLHAEDDEEWCD